MNLTAFCSHCLSISLPPCPYFPTPVTSQLGIVAFTCSRLPISRITSRTNTADLVSSFVLANEMLVNPVLGIDILLDASDPGATFDSQDHYDRRCFPGTREQYIADITNWVTESVNPPSSMYWMRGPAGVGKSAIAQTCAEKLKKSGHLGAAFFFTVNKHTNPLRLFTSIAYQLATALSDYRAALDERISKDKSLVEKKIPFQFGSLIVEPIRELEKQGKRVQPKAIFIDGLDECAGKDAQAEIIEIIASSVRERSIGLSSAALNLALCPHSSRTTSLLSFILLNSPSLVRQTVRSRCIFGVDSRTYWNNKISQNCRHHGQLTMISGPLSRQRLAYLLTLPLCCVMWLIHQTRNSANDCSLFSQPSPMQGNRDLRHFRNLMLSISTSWSRFQNTFSCLHNSFFPIL